MALSGLRKFGAGIKEGFKPTKKIGGKIYQYRGVIQRGDNEKSSLLREDMAKAKQKWNAKGYSVRLVPQKPIKLLWPRGSMIRGYAVYTRKQ